MGSPYRRTEGWERMAEWVGHQKKSSLFIQILNTTIYLFNYTVIKHRVKSCAK